MKIKVQCVCIVLSDFSLTLLFLSVGRTKASLLSGENPRALLGELLARTTPAHRAPPWDTRWEPEAAAPTSAPAVLCVRARGWNLLASFLQPHPHLPKSAADSLAKLLPPVHLAESSLVLVHLLCPLAGPCYPDMWSSTILEDSVKACFG